MKKLIVLLLLFPVVTFADPGSATQYLINEPASMMDIGMMKLNMQLLEMKSQIIKSIDGDPKRVKLSASYDYSEDKILVQFTVQKEGETAATACDTAIARLRFILPVHVIVAFQHFGYETKNKPVGFNAEIQDRVQLICTLKDAHTFDTMLEAKSALSGGRIYISGEVIDSE